MSHRTRRFFNRIIVTLLGCLLWAPAQAVLSVKITQGSEGAIPVAVVPFGWSGSTVMPPARIAEVVSADLQRSGRLATLTEKDLPGRPHDGSEIDFKDWRLLGTEYLVVGRTKVKPDGGYLIQFQLFDVFKGTQLTGYSIPSDAASLRMTAHRISDIVYEKLTGERGAFSTRIAYVTETRAEDGEARYSLQVSDSDGHGPRTALDSTQPILSPAWSPDGQKLAYVSYEQKRPSIYVQNLSTGAREKVTSYEGINSAPAWSPDGQKLALVLSKDGNPEIYSLDLASRQLTRLTKNIAIDTEPAWSPDGQHIAFTSDRGGRPQVYRTSTAGGRAQRLTFEGRYNARPRYSPDGEKLAMVYGNEGRYRIAVLDLPTGSLRILTSARLDESPSFSPNGSMIIYATTSGSGSSLAAVSVDGRVHQSLALQHGKVREPAWSPFPLGR